MATITNLRKRRRHCEKAGITPAITGRIKELIIRGGQNIAPAEIEEVAILYAEVIDCAVVGVPHAALGEVPYLFVVAEQGQLDAEALLSHCRRSLSSYKIPEAIHIV